MQKRVVLRVPPEESHTFSGSARRTLTIAPLGKGHPHMHSAPVHVDWIGPTVAAVIFVLIMSLVREPPCETMP